jgi:hypothetical protein
MLVGAALVALVWANVHPSLRCRLAAMAVVVNHLHLTDPLTDATAQAFRDFMSRIVHAGARAARVLRVGDTHLVLILDFASAEDADRIATDVGGPWMREHVIPLLARGPERSVGEVIASATA